MQLVVGAIIVDRLDAPSVVLAARRTRPAGRWEFPGGKVEPGEEPLSALTRELAEELGAAVRTGRELAPTGSRAWPLTDLLELRLWYAELADSEPTLSAAHQEIRWLPFAALDQLTWMDGDLAAVHSLMARHASAP